MDLTENMLRAIEALGRLAHGATAARIGYEITGRARPRTAHAGGHTLRALERRGLAAARRDPFFRKWVWTLTPAGERERKRLEHPTVRATR